MVFFAGGNHVDFEKEGAEVDVLAGELGGEGVENVAGNFKRLLDGIVAVIDDFGLDDGDEAGFLALFSVLGENLAVF